MRLMLSLGLIATVFLYGCVPIGIRMGTQPDLGSAGPVVAPAVAAVDHT